MCKKYNFHYFYITQCYFEPQLYWIAETNFWSSLYFRTPQVPFCCSCHRCSSVVRYGEGKKRRSPTAWFSSLHRSIHYIRAGKAFDSWYSKNIQCRNSCCHIVRHSQMHEWEIWKTECFTQDKIWNTENSRNFWKTLSDLFSLPRCSGISSLSQFSLL